MPHNVSQLLKTPHHDANVFRHQLLCQDDSAKDILESFNELTSSNEDTQVTQVKMCAWACVSVSFPIICACIYVCFDIQHLNTLSGRHLSR